MLTSTQVAVIAPGILPALRLQTRQINSIVTPIRYRTWAVKSRGLRGPVTQTVLRDVSQYTKYAVCSHDLDFAWDDMAVLDKYGLSQIAVSAESRNRMRASTPMAVVEEASADA